MSIDFNEDIIFQDNNILLINKAPGIPSQSDLTKDSSLIQMLEKELGLKIFPIHRIDRPASGVILYAKNRSSANKYTQFFQNRKIQKSYLAAVKNCPAEDEQTLKHQLFHNKKMHKSFASLSEARGSKNAVLEYKITGQIDNYTLLELDLKTGRFHQIRSQLAFIGSPIKGDVKYGARRANKNRSIHLHSFRIEIPFDEGKSLVAIARTPRDPVWDAFAQINPLLLRNNFEICQKKI